MIEMRRAQLSFGDGLIAEEVSDLRERANLVYRDFTRGGGGKMLVNIGRAMEKQAAP